MKPRINLYIIQSTGKDLLCRGRCRSRLETISTGANPPAPCRPVDWGPFGEYQTTWHPRTVWEPIPPDLSRVVRRSCLTRPSLLVSVPSHLKDPSPSSSNTLLCLENPGTSRPLGIVKFYHIRKRISPRGSNVVEVQDVSDSRETFVLSAPLSLFG